MAVVSGRARRWRAGVLLVAMLVALGLLLTCCPANRDGMPGQLAQSMDQTVTAARSGALALDQFLQRRATKQLTSVALSDARDQVTKAYKGIADLRAQDPVDVGRQRMLIGAMTGIIGQLDATDAVIRGVGSQPAPQHARDDLRAAADALESGYR